MAKKPETPKTPEEEAAEQVTLATMAEALQDYDAYIEANAANIWSYDEIPIDGLNLEDQLFVRSYIIDRNPVAAMRRLGHATDNMQVLKARAQKFLVKVEVQEAIDYLAKRMMEKLDITAERVQRAIAAVAFFDVRQVATFDRFGVNMLHSRLWTEEQAMAVKKVKMGQNGLEIEFYDRLKATEMLSKQLGVQPEENDAAETARLAADEAMTRIATVVGRLLPGGKGVIEQTIEEKRGN